MKYFDTYLMDHLHPHFIIFKESLFITLQIYLTMMTLQYRYTGKNLSPVVYILGLASKRQR